MKSIYQDENFANFWNRRSGDSGEVYKRYVLDPIMFDLIGSFSDKIVFELGCGNGYLAKKFIEEGASKVILSDISKYNLDSARSIFSSDKIKYFEHDATRKWDCRLESVDIVYSNMMLNEVSNIKTPIFEAFRVLKKGGIFIFSITHPSWNLFIYAQEKAGIKSDKIKGIGNYFRRGFAKYMMSAANVDNSDSLDALSKEFEVEHYQRPFSDYFNFLTDAGFKVQKIIEPEVTDELLKNAPRFEKYKDYPVSLIFFCLKEI
jgi:ubiquinone/menaquinone biosynthesis C-methylase UbiE